MDGVPVGRRYRLALTPGWMVYVGSAFGPGGVAARLAHHRRLADRPHWHIDFLRRYGALDAVWFSHDPIRRECAWAAVLAEVLGGVPPSFRFGASDCRCPAHLYRFPDRPTLAAFVTALRIRCPEHTAVVESTSPGNACTV
jgi:Uri superfamily endonuclease